jgi:5'-3' exonuclease
MAFDTSYLYFRAYFGVPTTFVTPEGHPVNAVRGTCDFISRLVGQYSPDVLACAWDDDWRPAWRVDLVPTYKTHRLDTSGGEDVQDDLERQVPWIREVLEAVGLPIVGAAEHEADDVLASLAAQHDGPCLVVTGDRDLFQLADDRTSVVYVARSVANHELVTPEVLALKYGLTAGRYVDFSVLRGDASDGLPGVKGIGEKTAAALVEQYPSLEAMVAAAQDPASDMKPAIRRNLLANPGYLPRAHRVVTAVPTLALPSLERRPVDADAVEELTERLSLGGSLQRLAAALS